MKNVRIIIVGVVVCAVCVIAGIVGLRGGADKAKALKPGPLSKAEDGKKVQIDTSLVDSMPVDPKPVDPNQVVVTVDGTAITEAQVDLRLRQQMARMGSSSGLPPEMIQQLSAQLRPRVVDGLIAEQLLIEQVRDSNMAPTEAEVMDQIKTIADGQEPALSVEQFKAMVVQQGYDFNNVKQEIGRELGIQKLLKTRSEGKVNVSDTDANSYYTEHAQEFDVPERVKVSHILIAPEAGDPNADPNATKAAARTKAEGLLAQVKEGKDFAELAKANSACPSSKEGGDLGFIERGKAVPSFEEAAFALEPGQISGVVETEFGYHILKVSERTQARHLPLSEVKDQIVDKLKQDRTRELAIGYIDELKAKATITYPVTAASPVTPTVVQ
jgi:peptidyl-prolyl cis-trans isomerase C